MKESLREASSLFKNVFSLSLSKKEREIKGVRLINNPLAHI